MLRRRADQDKWQRCAESTTVPLLATTASLVVHQNKLEALIGKRPTLNISPYKDVVREMKTKIDSTRAGDLCMSIDRAQGDEADIVYLVLGRDRDGQGFCRCKRR